VETLLAALEATEVANHLRLSRYTYPAVNAGHLLGIAMLVGAILPLDLRLIGVWSRVPLEPLAEVLRPTAAVGLALAAVTGGLLFSVSAREYWATGVFPAKMALVALGSAHALSLGGMRLIAASRARQRLAGVLSATLWLAALVAGRWIGYL
jgi:hypothetical protein